MATRSTSSEYQPAPRAASAGRGKPRARAAIVRGSGSKVKTNMCCPPAHNGERAFGKVTPSKPVNKMMKVSGGW